MKSSTSKIQALLQDVSTMANFKKLVDANPKQEYNETTLEQAFDRYVQLNDALLESAEKGLMDELTFTRRNLIETTLTEIQQYSQNAQQLIPAINRLSDAVENSRILLRIAKTLTIDIHSNELSRLRSKYKKTLESVENTEQLLQQAHTCFEGIKDIADQVDTMDIPEKLSTVQKQADEVNLKRNDIIAFAENIDITKKEVDGIKTDLLNRIKEDIETLLEKSKKLISDAETALELKQTEGIAMAISARLNKFSTSRSPGWWLFGALVFVALTLGFAIVMATGKFGGASSDAVGNISLIVSRIFVTLIGVAGAGFCASQFNKLRNLKEDYEYKVVLTKSILAFANKIKEYDSEDGSKLSEYLTKVLAEIHQDPLRDRRYGKKEDSVSVVQSITDLIKEIKQ